MASADMSAGGSKRKDVTSGKGKGTSNATKGWVEHLEDTDRRTDSGSGSGEAEWCIVHLYREDEEVAARNTRSNTSIVEAATNTISTPPLASSASLLQTPAHAPKEESSILCIPSVPSHITPSDFLSWVGPDTLNKVSHFRMVMTGQPNRYLVLMKFRESRDARWWRKLWDGRLFDSGGGGVEEETASVLYVRRVIFETPKIERPTAVGSSKEVTDNGSGSERSYTSSSERSFPDMTHDPFTPSLNPALNMSGNGNGNNSTLSEIPTCPVCLERMDIEDPPDPTSTTVPSGLLTILCQHVFHCACIQKWRGSGCPVCRHTQNKALPLRTYAGRAPFGRNPGEAETCSVCDCEEDLWICLVCGNVGCGRYKGGHAKRHWMDSQQAGNEDGGYNDGGSSGNNGVVGGHNFALEIETQYVWDYVGDKWVHRLIMGQGDGKLEYHQQQQNNSSSTSPDSEAERNNNQETTEETVPLSKLESIGLEYTHLLTTSLDSQRLYFESLLQNTIASKTSTALTHAQTKITTLESQLQSLTTELTSLKTTTIPSLEREVSRTTTRLQKSNDLARDFGRKLSEEKEISKGLFERIEFLNGRIRGLSGELEKLGEVEVLRRESLGLRAEVEGLRRENEELREENRDLGFFISGGERIGVLEREMGGEGVREGTVSLGGAMEGEAPGKEKVVGIEAAEKGVSVSSSVPGSVEKEKEKENGLEKGVAVEKGAEKEKEKEKGKGKGRGRKK